MSRRLPFTAAATALLALAGCTSTAKPMPGPTFDGSSVLRLVAFDSCEQLTEDLRAAAKDAVGPYGFQDGRAIPEAAVVADGARAMAQDSSAGKAAAPAFSGTNVHEQGVDEPDIVKTDGRRIVTVDGGVLRVVDAAARRQVARLDLGVAGYGQADLLLAGDRVLVLVTDQFAGHRMAKPYGRPGGAQLLLVDLAGQPRVISRFAGDGMLIDARQTGDTVRVVLSSTPTITFPQQPNVTDDKKRIASNRDAVDAAPADAWLPGWTVDGTRGRVGCGQVSRPPTFSGSSMLTVHTFDLRAPALGSADPVSVLADGDTVYGTPTSLYIANDQRWTRSWRSDRAVPQHTEIYRFDTSRPGKPVLAGSGRVPGWLINQYAMSEWDGHLRVATTDDDEDASAVRVLTQLGSRLVQVGEVTGLGKGERIYSVRFIGPRGYVVTFRQTDPLYSVDLSDPERPRVTGELKITGYSAHLQPAGDGRLIGIGQEADTRGVVQGTQVSLFDVSDPADPRRLAQEQVFGGRSEAEHDPHALLWWPATKLLVVPIADYGRAARVKPNAALALRVTDGGIERVGEVAQPTEGTQRGAALGIRRSLVIGDVLWTMSGYGLQASDLSTLDRLGWVPND